MLAEQSVLNPMTNRYIFTHSRTFQRLARCFGFHGKTDHADAVAYFHRMAESRRPETREVSDFGKVNRYVIEDDHKDETSSNGVCSGSESFEDSDSRTPTPSPADG